MRLLGIVDLLAGAATTLTTTTLVTTAVAVPDGGSGLWLFDINYEGLAGDAAGVDTFHPILQTSYNGGTTWQDLASTASMNGGVVAAVSEIVEALAPKASARIAATDGTTAASTITGTAIGPQVRIKAKITDADNDGQWRVNRARLLLYD